MKERNNNMIRDKKEECMFLVISFCIWVGWRVEQTPLSITTWYDVPTVSSRYGEQVGDLP